MMEWKSLRLSKGQNVQSFKEEFRKKALELNASLDTLEILMKYIGSLPNYISHTFLLSNPAHLDGASVQATHIESRRKYVQNENPSKHSEDHFKGKENIYHKEREESAPLHSL